jgi:carbonyl reductase 1
MSRIAVVTGGNRGLGLETCRQLAEKNLRVVLTARDPAAAEAAARGIDGEVEARRLDVADPASIAELAEALARDHGNIHVLVNNAAIALRGFDAEVARKTVDVNVIGTRNVTDALRPLLSPPASIVMVSSGVGELAGLPPDLRARFAAPELTRSGLDALIEEFVADVAAGRHGERGWPSSGYKVSKVALNALTRVLARELDGSGILVNAVCPGWVRTDMGGSGADRSVEDGARSIVWAATLEADGPSGGFFRDGAAISW